MPFRRILAAAVAPLLAFAPPAQALSLNQVRQQNTTPVPNPDGYTAQQLQGLPATAMGIGATIGGALAMPRVLNNGQLAKLLPGFGHVRREGFLIPGDGGIAEFTTKSTTCSLNSGAGDGGSQVGLTGPTGSTYIGCAYADLASLAAVSTSLWGSVADSNGTAGNGTDDTAAEQAAMNWAVTTGRKIVRTANGNGLMRRVTSPLTVIGHITMGGDYCAPYNTGNGLFLPGPGSTLFFDHSGQGIVFGSNAALAAEGMVLEDTCIYRAQPAPPANNGDGTAGGTWTPASNDFDIVEGEDDLLLRHVMFIDSTKGVLHQGGRLRVDGLEGQFFQNGIKITAAYDTPNLANIHMWPYGNGGSNAAINNYSLANLDALYVLRADNMFLTNFFAINAKHCIRIGSYSGANAGLSGSVNKGRGVNIDCDGFGDSAIYNDPGSQYGFVLTLSNFTAQGIGPGGPSGFQGNYSVDLEGTAGRLTLMGFQSSITRKSAVNVPNSGFTVNMLYPVLEAYGQDNGSEAAIAAVSGSYVSTFGAAIGAGGTANIGFSGTGSYTSGATADIQGRVIAQGVASGSVTRSIAQGAINALPAGSGEVLISDTTHGAQARASFLGGQSAANNIIGSEFLAQNPGVSSASIPSYVSGGKVGVYYDTTLSSYAIYNNSGGTMNYTIQQYATTTGN